MNKYILWAEYLDGRKPLHEVYPNQDSERAQVRFGELCGAAGVEYVLLTHNGNAIDSWGT